MRSCCCRCWCWRRRRPSRSRTRATAAGDIDLHRSGRVGAGIAAHRHRCVANMRPSWERTLLDKARPAGPAVGSRIIQLQGIRGIRIEHPLEPCSYSLAARGRRCAWAGEGIATAKYPQFPRSLPTPARSPHWAYCPRRPTVSRYVVIIQRVQIGVVDVASTSYVHVPVDDPEPRPSQVAGMLIRLVLKVLATGSYSHTCPKDGSTFPVLYPPTR